MARTHRLALTLCGALLVGACQTETSGPEAPPEETPSSATAQALQEQPPPLRLAEDVRAALATVPDGEVLGLHEDGVPFMVQGAFGTVGRSLHGLSAREAHARVRPVLERVTPLFRLKPEDLVVRRISQDAQGHTHVRYAQMKNGLPVIGHELIVHIDDRGRVYAANGSARDGEETVGLQARVAPTASVSTALYGTAGHSLSVEGEPRLVYYRPEGSRGLVLAYEVVVAGEGMEMPLRDHVFVSAQDGAELGRAPDIHNALNRAVYSANNGSTLPGTLRRSEGGAATADLHIDQNYDHLGTTYNCYKVNFNRDSYNNAGATLMSSVHYGTNYVNAFWNGTQMVYGDGDGVTSAPLGRDLDVAVHELTHAVTSSESNLTYSNESGALNEGMSDIFAAYCESWTRSWATDADVWMIGEDIWTPATAGDALRYMANPTQDGASTDYYPERYTGTADSGGVHWNSGIANLAFKLLATGGTHPREKTFTQVPGIGVQKAGAIFYKANTDYFTASTTFAQALVYTEMAASALYGLAERNAVTLAWRAVGVGPTVPCEAQTGLSGATGSQTLRKFSVPLGSGRLTVRISGGSGDADLYVRQAAAPTLTDYDCRPYVGTSDEMCIIPNPTSGTWYAMLRGYSAYSNVTLEVCRGDQPCVLVNGEPLTGLSGAGASEFRCSLQVPAGASNLTFTLGGGSGDADLYVKHGLAPTTGSYDCRPYLGGNSESCTIASPAAGTWHVMLRGFGSYTGTTFLPTFTYSPDTTPPETSIDIKPYSPSMADVLFGFASNELSSSYACRVDGAPFYTPCARYTVWTDLVSGPHQLEVRAVDPASNADATPASHAWSVDAVNPDTSILSGPVSPSNSPNAAFTFGSNESPASFECQLDSSGFFSYCYSPFNITGLADGTHTLLVRARDTAGNVDPTPASYTWSVDTVKPDTTIISGPTALIASATATFEFTSTESGGTFRCILDAGPAAPCTTPLSLSLADGTHTLKVFAVDTAGNADETPAERTWRVDTTPPETTIDSAPPAISNTGSDTFNFNSDEAAVGVSYECRLDGAASFTACSDPITYTGLPDGPHSLAVRAKDLAGHVDATPATYSWVVNNGPPETSIGTKPSAFTSSTSATFSFDSNEAGVTFECRLDAATSFTSCSTPLTLTGLSEARHTLHVRARDAAGNFDGTPARHTWTVDLTPPDTQIVSASTSTTSGTFDFAAPTGTGSFEPGVSYECSVNGGAFAPCADPATITRTATTMTLSVRAKDFANNVDPTPATHTW